LFMDIDNPIEKNVNPKGLFKLCSKFPMLLLPPKNH